MTEQTPLPPAIQQAIQPLLDQLPPDQAMRRLVVSSPRDDVGQLAPLVAQVTANPAIQAIPALAAGLWLYVDELDRSHQVSQVMKNPTGSFWHGIMHRREGDFSNSHYWFRQTGAHPAMPLIADYNGHDFIDQVADAHHRGETPSELIEMQHREWATLFAWCAEQG